MTTTTTPWHTVEHNRQLFRAEMLDGRIRTVVAIHEEAYREKVRKMLETLTPAQVAAFDVLAENWVGTAEEAIEAARRLS